MKLEKLAASWLKTALMRFSNVTMEQHSLQTSQRLKDSNKRVLWLENGNVWDPGRQHMYVRDKHFITSKLIMLKSTVIILNVIVIMLKAIRYNVKQDVEHSGKSSTFPFNANL